MDRNGINWRQHNEHIAPQTTQLFRIFFQPQSGVGHLTNRQIHSVEFVGSWCEPWQVEKDRKIIYDVECGCNHENGWLISSVRQLNCRLIRCVCVCVVYYSHLDRVCLARALRSHIYVMILLMIKRWWRAAFTMRTHRYICNWIESTVIGRSLRHQWNVVFEMSYTFSAESVSMNGEVPLPSTQPGYQVRYKLLLTQFIELSGSNFHTLMNNYNRSRELREKFEQNLFTGEFNFPCRNQLNSTLNNEHSTCRNKISKLRFE